MLVVAIAAWSESNGKEKGVVRQSERLDDRKSNNSWMIANQIITYTLSRAKSKALSGKLILKLKTEPSPEIGGDDCP